MIKYLIFFILMVCSISGWSHNIKVSGSQEIIGLMSQLSKFYMSQRQGVYFQISTNKDDSDISSLVRGDSDLIMLNRKITLSESKLFNTIKLKHRIYLLGYQILFIYVNKNNKIQYLTTDQLRDIFSGKITNWKDVGGNDSAINLYGKGSHSLSYRSFQSKIMLDKKFSDLLQFHQNSIALQTIISADSNGIGFDDHYFQSSDIKPIAILFETNGDHAYYPTFKSIHSGKYPLSQAMYLVTTDSALSKKPILSQFLKWIYSPNAQIVVMNLGYFSRESKTKSNSNPDSIVIVENLNLESIYMEWAKANEEVKKAHEKHKEQDKKLANALEDYEKQKKIAQEKYQTYLAEKKKKEDFLQQVKMSTNLAQKKYIHWQKLRDQYLQKKGNAIHSLFLKWQQAKLDAEKKLKKYEQLKSKVAKEKEESKQLTDLLNKSYYEWKKAESLSKQLKLEWENSKKETGTPSSPEKNKLDHSSNSKSKIGNNEQPIKK